MLKSFYLVTLASAWKDLSTDGGGGGAARADLSTAAEGRGGAVRLRGGGVWGSRGGAVRGGLRGGSMAGLWA